MGPHDVALIQPGSENSARVARLEIDVIRGFPTSPQVLEESGVAGAKSFIACTTNDEVNIVSCLVAKRLGVERTVCVLYRPGLTDLGGEDELAKSLGVDVVVHPGMELAAEIIRIVTVPGASDVDTLLGGKVALIRVEVEEDAPITKKAIRDLKMPKSVVLALYRRGETMGIPDGDTVLQVGDKLTAFGRERSVAKLIDQFTHTPHKRRAARRAMIVGGGVVGYTVAQGLTEAGWTVTIIEADYKRCEQIAPRISALVVHGDGSDMSVLEEEQAEEMSVLIAVTSNDEKNLLVSLMAKNLGVPRIVTRAVRLANEKMFERLGIDVVMSAHGAAIRSVLRGVIDPRNQIRAELEHGDIHVIELELPSGFPPIELRQLRLKYFAIIGAVIRGRHIIVAKASTVLSAGDHLFIFCSQEDEEGCRNFFLNPPREWTLKAKD
jgi:trk system potassium uptake protein TrkA